MLRIRKCILWKNNDFNVLTDADSFLFEFHLLERSRNNAGHCKLKIYKDKQRINLMKTGTNEESKTRVAFFCYRIQQKLFEVRLIYLEIQWDYQMVTIENVSVFRNREINMFGILE